MTIEERVARHYTQGDLGAAVLKALRAAGKDLDRLTLEDLAPVDEFHVRGRAATMELGAGLELTPAMHVLDVGSGIGGPSRHLAAAYGCRITGLDLTEEYCRVATMLAERVGLAAQVSYRQGNALAMRFDDGTFAAAYTQHVAMNIAASGSTTCCRARAALSSSRSRGRGPRRRASWSSPWSCGPSSRRRASRS